MLPLGQAERAALAGWHVALWRLLMLLLPRICQEGLQRLALLLVRILRLQPRVTASVYGRHIGLPS
jgi:hypothetical protein